MRAVWALITASMSSLLLATCTATTPTYLPTETVEVPQSPLTSPTATSSSSPYPDPLAYAHNPLEIETPTEESAPVATPATITVEAGDTLLGLALRYGVPMAALQLQNQMGAETLVRLGERIEIPSPAAWQGASPYWIVYRIAEGDTLSGIALAYGVTVSEIESTNGISAVDPIRQGQLLILPLQNLVLASPSQPDLPSSILPSESLPMSPTPASSVLATPAPTSAVAPPPTIALWPYETVRIMNAVRANHGLPPLAYNESLAQAAQIQANDCAQRGWCSHTGSDGSDIKERILRAGYDPATWAECWAQRQTPQAAIDIWMDEIPPNDPHRRTLLSTWLTEVGIGVSKTSWGYYFIADFGRSR